MELEIFIYPAFPLSENNKGNCKFIKLKVTSQGPCIFHPVKCCDTIIILRRKLKWKKKWMN